MAKPQKSSESSGPGADLVAQAFDPSSKYDEFARAVKELDPEEAVFFIARLEAALRKRKLQLTGYVVAVVVWFIAMVFALAYFGATEGFTGWVFLVPFGFVGVILYAFGRWADKVGELHEDQRAALRGDAEAKIEPPAPPKPPV